MINDNNGNNEMGKGNVRDVKTLMFTQRNFMSLSDVYRRMPDALGDTLAQSRMEGMSILDGLSNLNIETTNISVLKTVIPEHMISPLNTSIVN